VIRRYAEFYERHWVWMSAVSFAVALGLFMWCAVSGRSTFSTVAFGTIVVLLALAFLFRVVVTAQRKH
jgi:multisubunit Na+/H+ antiporter MnhE subunit